MEIRHLRYFVAAAEELSLTRAAEKLHISQPAVSRLVRDLEEELGSPLFFRQHLGLKLTTAGEKFLGYARQIIRLGQEAKRVIGGLKEYSQHLNIGFVTTPIGAFLTSTFRIFRLSNPEVLFQMHELCPGDQIKALRKQQIDIALAGNPGGLLNQEYDVMPLFDRPLAAVIPQSHRLAGQSPISLKELAKEQFIGFNEASMPGRNQVIVNACRKAGFDPDLRYHVASVPEALVMIGSGVGVSLLTDDMVRVHQFDTHFASITERLERYPVVAAWRRDTDSELVRTVVEFIRTRAQDCYDDTPKLVCN